MERNLLSKIITASKDLDNMGFYREADILTLVMKKIAQSDMGVLGQGAKQLTDNLALKPGAGYNLNPAHGSIAADAPGNVPDGPAEIPSPKNGESQQSYQQRLQQSPYLKTLQNGDLQQSSQDQQYAMNQFQTKLQQVGTQIQNTPQGPQKQDLQQQYNVLQQSISNIGQMLNQSFNQQSIPSDPTAPISPVPTAAQNKTIDYNKLSKMKGM